MNWDDVSACRGMYIDDYYDVPNGLVNRVTRQMCASCPVLAACRIASLPEAWGFWAGLYQGERQQLRSRIGYIPRRDDADVAVFRRAAQRGFATGDYHSALAPLIGSQAATEVLGVGDEPSRAA